jgi:beta-xylosidase
VIERTKSLISINLLVVLLTSLALSACAQPQVETSPTSAPTEAAVPNTPEAKEMDIFKKPLVTDIYTADPSAHVFEGKLYIYPSHDLEHDRPESPDGSHYDMKDYHVLSLEDMHSLPVDHGEVLHVDDVPWAEKQMWAPDAAFKNDTYYFYFPAKDHDGVFRIGVATGGSPAGPFTPQSEPIPGSFSIDPAVFVDDDGRAYMYFGGLWGGQLEKWRTGSFDPEGAEPGKSEPALGPKVAKLSPDMLSFDGPIEEISIIDEDGQPLPAGDNRRRFFEAAWVHKYNGTYYLSYSTGDTHLLVYATGEGPTGPFVYRGVILTPVIGWTTHHSIVEFQEQWYLFYHDSSLSGGVSHKRCVKVAELVHNPDGSIETIEP